MSESIDIQNCGREILSRLVTVCKNVAIYPLDHPTVVESAVEICEKLKPVFIHHSQIGFNIVNAEIYFEKQLLVEESMKHLDFIHLLMRRGVNNLLFGPEVNPDSIIIFFSLINRKQEANLNEKSLKSKLKEHGCKGINFGTLVGIELRKDVCDLMEKKPITAQSSYNSAMECMQSMEHDILSNKPINTNALQAVVLSLMQDFLNDSDAIKGLVSIKNYEEELFHHSINVAVTCLLIGSKLSLPEKHMRTVGVAGLLHDIGKLKISREILSKPGKLNDKEWAIMKRHPIEGARMLMQYENIGELPVLAALQHHSRYDLNGYPSLKGTQFPHALARIVTVADVFEALTANRSYRPACNNPKEAVDILISGSGTQFDPMLVKLFLSIIGIFPPGTVVRIKTGETALVIEENTDNPLCPKVRLIREDTGELAEEPLIDTAEDPAKYSIVGVADSQ